MVETPFTRGLLGEEVAVHVVALQDADLPSLPRDGLPFTVGALRAAAVRIPVRAFQRCCCRSKPSKKAGC